MLRETQTFDIDYDVWEMKDMEQENVPRSCTFIFEECKVKCGWKIDV